MNSNVQSVRFGRLAQRERRCLTSTRSGVQIPHRPPLTQRPPAMGVFFVSGEDSLDLNPARAKRPSGPFVVEQAEGRRRPANPRSGCAQIPHRPPLTQRPPAMGVFFISGELRGDLNPARGLPNRLEDHLVGKTAPMCKILLFGVGRSSEPMTIEQRGIASKSGDLGFCKRGAVMWGLGVGKCRLSAHFTYPEQEYFAHSPRILDKMKFSDSQERRRNDVLP